METDQAPTGADEYLASRMQDPQYADAWLRERIGLALDGFAGSTFHTTDDMVNEVMAVVLDHQELIENIMGHIWLHARDMDFVLRKMTTEERRAWDAYLAGWKYRMDTPVHEDGWRTPATHKEADEAHRAGVVEYQSDEGCAWLPAKDLYLPSEGDPNIARYRVPADWPAGRAGDGGGCDGTSNGPTRKEAAMNETKTEWRDCADPDELAAAVAAGVEVRWAKPGWSSGEWALSTASSPPSFAGAMRRGNRYSVPTSWTWSPEPPATGAERYLAGRMADPEYRAAYEATSPPAPDDLRERLRLGIEDAVNDYADVVMDIMDAEVVRHAGWLAARLEEADAERTTLRHRLVETAPTPPPAPPWPGAVLSGLTDEDGEPTWLALAPNVLGEDVRTCVDFPWFICGSDNAVTPYWVEVRAPRAPETERVPWWAAKDRRGLAGDPFVEVGSDDEGPWVRVVVGGTKLHSLVAPDGTVEVLSEDGES